jgi:hypothetical protein
MTGLRDLIGTAAVKAMTGMEWANVHADFPDRAADTIIAALKSNGLIVVPVEPTDEMVDASLAFVDPKWLSSGATSGKRLAYSKVKHIGRFRAMLAASPFAKEFE